MAVNSGFRQAVRNKEILKQTGFMTFKNINTKAGQAMRLSRFCVMRVFSVVSSRFPENPLAIAVQAFPLL
jgi:hypothetical protein